MISDLPTPRVDGLCVWCTKDAVTKCGRFCRKCLASRVRHENPGDIHHHHRTIEQMQEYIGDQDADGALANAVRALEDGR